MVLIISLIAASLLVFPGRRFIRDHAGACYAVCAAASVLVAAAVWSGASQALTGAGLMLANVFLQGGLAGALFIFVMYAGAVPDRSAFRRAVLPIRGQLSIMACILTLGHNAAYGKRYFAALFTQAASLRLNVLLAACCSLVMILIMLPLFVTSFLSVRKRMKPRVWKRLQRAAYAFYALMFIHVLLLNTTSAREGQWTALLNVALYALVFLVYASLRLCRAAQKHGHKGMTPVIQLGCSALMIAALMLILLPARTGGASAQEAPAAEAVSWADGKYKGAAIGYNGRLTVSVVVEDGKLSRVVCTGSVEDEPYLTDATEGVFGAMLAENTIDVDAVSGATTTSDALIEAVRAALEQAEE